MGLRTVRAGLDKYLQSSRSSDHWRPRRGSRGGGGRSIRSSHPRSATRGSVGLTEVCVEAASKARRTSLGPQGPRESSPRLQTRAWRLLMVPVVEEAAARRSTSLTSVSKYRPQRLHYHECSYLQDFLAVGISYALSTLIDRYRPPS
jgi:hypothetical protein